MKVKPGDKLRIIKDVYPNNDDVLLSKQDIVTFVSEYTVSGLIEVEFEPREYKGRMTSKAYLFEGEYEYAD